MRKASSGYTRTAVRSGLGAGLGAKEIYDPGKNLRLDVLGVAFTSRGAEISVEVFTNAALWCPEQLLVVRDAATDAVLAHKYFQPEGYFFAGFIKSGVIPCRETGVLVVPDASAGPRRGADPGGAQRHRRPRPALRGRGTRPLRRLAAARGHIECHRKPDLERMSRRVHDVEYEVIVNPMDESHAHGPQARPPHAHAAGMGGPREGLTELLAFALDQLGQNNKGRALIEGLNVAGLSQDPERIREVYARNRAAINELAAELDVRELIGQIAGGSGGVSQEQASGAALGFVVGGLAGSALQRFLQSR